ncbi:MAG: radical SAM protein [Candidatus Aenigmatarchaeota archaeon]
MHEEKIKRILRWFNGEISPPFKMVLIPTNRCNLKCPYCPNAIPRLEGKFKKEYELSTDEWVRIVKEGLELGIKEWSIIGGGEPFLRKEVVLKVVKLVKNHAATECEIITNGSLIDEEVARNLVVSRLDRILFSIDGPNAKIHDSLRGVKGTFKRVESSLKLLNKWKERLKEDKPYVKVNMVINKLNFKKLSNMVKFVHKFKAKELALHPMREYFDSVDLNEFSLTEEDKLELQYHVEKARKIAEKLNVFLNIEMLLLKTMVPKEKKLKGKILKKIEKCSCFEPLYTMLVDSNGFVNCCSPSGSGIKSLNVRRMSLKEIWLSRELFSLRKKVLNGGSFTYCDKCGLTDIKFHIREELLKSVEHEV